MRLLGRAECQNCFFMLLGNRLRSLFCGLGLGLVFEMLWQTRPKVLYLYILVE